MFDVVFGDSAFEKRKNWCHRTKIVHAHTYGWRWHTARPNVQQASWAILTFIGFVFILSVVAGLRALLCVCCYWLLLLLFYSDFNIVQFLTHINALNTFSDWYSRNRIPIYGSRFNDNHRIEHITSTLGVSRDMFLPKTSANIIDLYEPRSRFNNNNIANSISHLIELWKCVCVCCVRCGVCGIDDDGNRTPAPRLEHCWCALFFFVSSWPK